MKYIPGGDLNPHREKEEMSVKSLLLRYVKSFFADKIRSLKGLWTSNFLFRRVIYSDSTFKTISHSEKVNRFLKNSLSNYLDLINVQ